MGTKEKWRFVDTPGLGPALNMAVDEAILISHRQGKVPPTIRFYTWQPATLSIGYFQRAHEEIDLERLKAYRLGFVRRMTGGRAVLHDKELTYSVVVSEQHPLIPASVTEAYRVISTGLLQGFLDLGLKASFFVPHTEEERELLKNPRSSVCFDSSSWYELVVEGRKVAGSAQTRQQGVVLQHGSILLDLDVDLLFELIRFTNVGLKERMKKHFLAKAVAINQLINPPLSLDKVKEVFKLAFAKALNVELVEEDLTEEEKQLAQVLVKEKYGHDQWNFRR